MAYLIKKWKKAAENDSINAIVWCPECTLRLGLTHNIADDGTVTPSLVCTHDPCDFHENVKLEGWPIEPEL